MSEVVEYPLIEIAITVGTWDVADFAWPDTGYDGGIVILEDRKDVQNGDIVAALIDGETTLKRYVTEHGRPYLKAENPLYPNLVPARELRIEGVMVSLVRKQMPAARRKRG